MEVLTLSLFCFHFRGEAWWHHSAAVHCGRIHRLSVLSGACSSLTPVSSTPVLLHCSPSHISQHPFPFFHFSSRSPVNAERIAWTHWCGWWCKWYYVAYKQCKIDDLTPKRILGIYYLCCKSMLFLVSQGARRAMHYPQKGVSNGRSCRSSLLWLMQMKSCCCCCC